MCIDAFYGVVLCLLSFLKTELKVKNILPCLSWLQCIVLYCNQIAVNRENSQDSYAPVESAALSL